MACVTLKRSLEFDPLHHGTCTPRPQKRRRCVPMCVSPQSAAAATARHTDTAQSHFSGATPTLTPEQIAQNVREQIRRLKRRRILQCGERSMECEGGYESPASPPSPASPTSHPLPSPSSSGSAGVASLHHQHQQHQSTAPSKEKPLFTFKQVNLICEQLLRERETNIREEYDKVLATKLAEQYDCFVRFTTDQIQQRLSQAALPSYLS